MLDNIIYIIDTREQKNKHITDYMDQKRKKYKYMKLDQGDYSACIEYNDNTKDLIQRDIYFTNDILIERKANLDELVNNLLEKPTGDNKLSGERLEYEFMRINRAGAKIIMLLENPKGLQDIIDHKYRSKYLPQSFYARIKTLEARYNIDLRFIDPLFSGMEITNIIRYHIRELLK